MEIGAIRSFLEYNISNLKLQHSIRLKTEKPSHNTMAFLFYSLFLKNIIISNYIIKYQNLEQFLTYLEQFGYLFHKKAFIHYV